MHVVVAILKQFDRHVPNSPAGVLYAPWERRLYVDRLTCGRSRTMVAKRVGTFRSKEDPSRLVDQDEHFDGEGQINGSEAPNLLAAHQQIGALVFDNGDGVPPGMRGVVKQHKGVLARAKLNPSVRLYDLRHTHATLLLAAGVHPKIVSERLGHSNITITLDTNSHVLPGMQRESAAKLDAMPFSGSPNGAAAALY